MKPSKKAIETLAKKLYEVGSEAWLESHGSSDCKFIWRTASKHQRAAQLAVAKYILENFVHKKLIPPSGW